jgi:hypothetical protein
MFDLENDTPHFESGAAKHKHAAGLLVSFE